MALVTTGLTAVTVVSGAFVAGNDAGRAYNDWPYMNGKIVPWEDMSEDFNIFENTAVVQFDHRILAYATAAAVGATVHYSSGLKKQLAQLRVVTPQVSRGLTVMGGLVVAQVTLGIGTLAMYVPVGLAATHQLGSLALLTSGLYLSHSLRYIGTAAARKQVVKKVIEKSR